jgi:hypothetical protein
LVCAKVQDQTREQMRAGYQELFLHAKIPCLFNRTIGPVGVKFWPAPPERNDPIPARAVPPVGLTGYPHGHRLVARSCKDGPRGQRCKSCQTELKLFRLTFRDRNNALKPLPGANHWKDAVGIQDFTRRFERRARFGYRPWIVIKKVFARNKILRKRVRSWVPSRLASHGIHPRGRVRTRISRLYRASVR